jgi:hypothetical protein
MFLPRSAAASAEWRMPLGWDPAHGLRATERATRALSELAAVASERHEFSLATRLYGRVAALRKAIGAPLAPAERVRHEWAVTVTRGAFDEESFIAAWESGLDMSLEQVITEAQALAVKVT